MYAQECADVRSECSNEVSVNGQLGQTCAILDCSQCLFLLAWVPKIKHYFCQSIVHTTRVGIQNWDLDNFLKKESEAESIPMRE